MKTAIIGGGFGLYGYLPALMQNDVHEVILPIRYQESMAARDDIRDFIDKIIWARSDDELLENVQLAIIAVPPASQPLWVDKCLDATHITHLILEKPVAITPAQAGLIQQKLVTSQKTFRIGYNFRFTPWGRDLLETKDSLSSISWKFRAHHYAADIINWKKNHFEGGGALRFYGIHLIALLAELGYEDVLFSEITSSHTGEAARWEAELIGPRLSKCKINVSSDDDNNSFTIEKNGCELLLTQPFESASSSTSFDQRVPIIEQLLADLLSGNTNYQWYTATNNLWSKIEDKTIFSYG